MVQNKCKIKYTEYYTEKGYTVYTCFLWYQEHEKKFYFDLEIGNGKLNNYRYLENYYSYKELDEKYNFILSEY